jgi:hypothetical protein
MISKVRKPSKVVVRFISNLSQENSIRVLCRAACIT